MKKTNLVLLILFSLSFVSVNAQQMPLTTGGSKTSESGCVSYSIGQVFFSIGNSYSGSISPGMQQPIEISEIVGVNTGEKITNVRLYPNPTANKLFIEIIDKDFKKDSDYLLLDVNGKIIAKNKLKSITNQVSLINLNPGIYFLKIYTKKELNQSFKIIKN